MNRMVRNLNYTGRRRIHWKSVPVQLRRAPGRPATFELDLMPLARECRNLGLPASATVWLEAYSRDGHMRFSLGTVGSLVLPPDRELRGFAHCSRIRYRIKVVDAEGGSAKLLAHADGLPPEPEGGSANSLLPVLLSDALGQEIWKVTFDEGGPILELNELVPGGASFAATPEFAALVHPAALRCVLEHILVERKDTSGLQDGTSPEWMRAWIAMVQTSYGAAAPPEWNEQDDEAYLLDCRDWIDDATRRFAARHRFADRVSARSLTEMA